MAFLSFPILFVLLSYCSGLILPVKSDDSLIKSKVSYEPIFTTDNQFSNFVSEDGKSRRDRPASKNSVIFKQKVSNKPIFTPDSEGYNFLSDEDGEDRNDQPILEQSVRQKEQISREPFVKIDSSDYGSISKDDQRNKKGFWGSTMKKVLAKSEYL